MLRKFFKPKPLPRVSLTDGTTFEVPRNKTVLEAALENGVDYPHDCTVGTCGSCRSRLLSGKVDAITPFGYALSREELEAGYILACQALPSSDLVLEVVLDDGGPSLRTTGRIVECSDLTHDIRRVTWETAAPISYRAGQYMNIHWPGGPGSRSYSFSSAPVAGGSTRLTTFIRRVPGGAFTERLFEEGFRDTPFDLDGPHGQFWLRDGTGPILLIGGGSGLAPLMSLLEDAQKRGVARDALLLFGGRAERDLYCLDEIARIGQHWSGGFDYWPVLSEEAGIGRRSGMVTAQIPLAVDALGGPERMQAYLCGPPAMIDAGVAALRECGIPMTHIHYDKFTDASTGAA